MATPAQTTCLLDLSVAGRLVPTPCDELGAGPKTLLLPPLSSISAREEMLPLARELSDSHHCLVPDWPGFGARDRGRLPLEPASLHAFLDAFLAAAPGPYAIGIAAGHAAGYLVAAAGRHPSLFERLVLIAPTWRGPLPTVMGEARVAWFGRIRRALERPVTGEWLYRLNVSRPVIGRMMRAHVYADPTHVTPEVIAAKHVIARQDGGRFGTAAFVTGGLDPVESRADFLSLLRHELPPIKVLRPESAPRRSGAEMDALIDDNRVSAARIPGALSPHEEYPRETAAAIRVV
ncbi:alpha/beta fold hydrolase [Methylobacterium gnaphalii]|uniref:AB hydrolase-1 domain-containing protein n=1 Tax=Methylobacterium gnaphalii TaxID=1010610 RepID=A0A512JI88_9HYPH|nr:alpha/beta fold hydrolase [Methylobacterium gnaphalii]GEP09669.1 hypothetical protein MGN01_15140 [Methylobacterium gnaphalii]GJD67745.1 hypothetical protein MMMDOFMJ_0661 [Methylobacterium gnaphalii]GLS50087.1 hypothetical protein GCM10007885_29390 [Methylobacterium gnaphalii]